MKSRLPKQAGVYQRSHSFGIMLRQPAYRADVHGFHESVPGIPDPCKDLPDASCLQFGGMFAADETGSGIVPDCLAIFRIRPVNDPDVVAFAHHVKEVIVHVTERFWLMHFAVDFCIILSCKRLLLLRRRRFVDLFSRYSERSGSLRPFTAWIFSNQSIISGITAPLLSAISLSSIDVPRIRSILMLLETLICSNSEWEARFSRPPAGDCIHTQFLPWDSLH